MYITFAIMYGMTLLLAQLLKAVAPRQWKPNGRIVVMGTFHNPGWHLSHIFPLWRCGMDAIILVRDEPLAPIDGVCFIPQRPAARGMGGPRLVSHQLRARHHVWPWR